MSDVPRYRRSFIIPKAYTQTELEVAQALLQIGRHNLRYLTQITPHLTQSTTSNSSKNMRNEDEEGNQQTNHPADEDDVTLKSERKRKREKQRRSELTNSFDDLATFVLQLDAENDEQTGEKDSKKKSRRLSSSNRNDGGDNDTGGMTRVDLIMKSLAIMKRLQRENTELKQQLARSGPNAGKNEVSMVLTFILCWQDFQ
jgi:uncharacterized protein Veg